MMRTMGNSAAMLEGYLNLSGALAQGTLGPELGELIALVVAEVNQCAYCASAHSLIGEKLVGISSKTLTAARKGESINERTDAALEFARTLVVKAGHLSDQDIDAVKKAGFTEGEIGEIVGHVALNVLTNYFNNTANTEIDFPLVTLLRSEAA